MLNTYVIILAVIGALRIAEIVTRCIYRAADRAVKSV